MLDFAFWRRIAIAAAVCGATGAASGAAPAQGDTVARSALDAQLFYQLLIGEMELRNGQPGTAYQVFMEAARRTKDPQLFRRAMDVALQARAGDEALAATQAWRLAQPGSADPLRLQLQILAATNKLADAVEPLRALLKLTPHAERPALITALPRVFDRAADKRQSAQTLESVLETYLVDAGTRAAAQVTIGRAWLAAGDSSRALEIARQAHADQPDAIDPVVLAIELMRTRPEAEALVTQRLARPGTPAALRLAYVRLLTAQQRYVDAIAQLELATREAPEQAQAHLTLGALHLELRQFALADASLQRYLELAQPAAAAAPAPASASASASASTEAGTDDDAGDRAEQGVVQAWLMLAQSAEQQADFARAEGWLARIDDPQRALEVQARRASLMARQGRIDEAVASLRRVPERSETDARAKLVAEAQLLREVKRWNDAYTVFATANQRFPDDADLLYEQAMVAEKINRLDDMERQLRRVIELKPDHGHAQNALGYSLADRGQRLPEARDLIQRALELRPGDPFITDSLGWVEFRLGNREEALRLLRAAWGSRPDTEIGAHLGEVLWSLDRKDEARTIWRQARQRDAANEVLRETLTRLQVGL